MRLVVALVVGMLLAVEAGAARCPKACKRLLAGEKKACKAACAKGKAGKHCRTACNGAFKTRRATCKAALDPTPPLCGATTTTTITSSTTTTTIAGPGAIVTLDEARATTETLPLDGGTVTATGADGTVYSLTIRPGSLLVETPITLTPIVSISGDELPDGSLFGVHLEPSGLRLFEFAELSITPPGLSPTADIAGFSYAGNGDDLHRYPAALEAGRIVLHVIHFSGAGAKICVELCPPPVAPPPTPPVTESQLEAAIAALDPRDPLFASKLADLLHAYWDLIIAPDLPLMEQNCEFAKHRIYKVFAWSRTNQLILDGQGFEEENQMVGPSVFKAVANCWAETAATCLDWSNAYQLNEVVRLARTAQLLGGDEDDFNPGDIRPCSGLWGGTIKQERTLEMDSDYEEGGAHYIRTARQRWTQQWQIIPKLIGDPCEDCQSRLFEATWSGSASIDNRSIEDYGFCTKTATLQGQVEGSASPSAFFVGITSDQSKFYLNRAAPGVQNAPEYGDVVGPYDSTTVNCDGSEETRPFGSLRVPENWTPWPFSQGLPLDRTEPTVPWTSQGEHIDRQERPVIGGVEVITTRWTWQLTLEPDGAP